MNHCWPGNARPEGSDRCARGIVRVRQRVPAVEAAGARDQRRASARAAARRLGETSRKMTSIRVSRRSAGSISGGDQPGRVPGRRSRPRDAGARPMPVRELERVDGEFEVDQAARAALDVERAAGRLVARDLAPHPHGVGDELGRIARRSQHRGDDRLPAPPGPRPSRRPAAPGSAPYARRSRPARADNRRSCRARSRAARRCPTAAAGCRRRRAARPRSAR